MDRSCLHLLIVTVLASGCAAAQLQGGAIDDVVKHGRVGGGIIRDFWFDTPTSPIASLRVVAPANTTLVSEEDTSFRRDTGELRGTDFVWPYVIPPNRRHAEVISRATSSDAVIVPDPLDETRWLYVGTGAATISISCTSRTVQVEVSTSTQGEGSVDTLLGYAAGSLRRHVVEDVATRLDGTTPAAALRLFATRDHTAASYVRNAAVWTPPSLATMVAVWNSTSNGAQRAGTLISPRHVIFARHYQIAEGATLRFVTGDDVVVTRTMTAKASLPIVAGYYPDITVGVLDSDVPAGIAFAKVLPGDWEDYMPSPGPTRRIPALTLDQEAKALVSDLVHVADSTEHPFATFARPLDPALVQWYEDKVGGDSGQPAFLIINGEPVLLTVWTFGGGGSGTSIVRNKDAINALMTSLGGGYQLTEVDLSGFNSY
mgnify:CR=1 FL=1